MPTKLPKIGFTCAYTPLPIIDATGFSPYRILPMSNAPDNAGQWLHDNLCPHVKRILDRAVSNDLPDLEGLVVVNSCDAMRRLADAWQKVRPHDSLILLDLPTTADKKAITFYASEITRMANTLVQWNGTNLSLDKVRSSIETYNEVAAQLDQARRKAGVDLVSGSSVRLQQLYNQISTSPIPISLEIIEKSITESSIEQSADSSVPLFVFGNVLCDPEMYRLLESCGVNVVSDDLCTGSRLFHPIVCQSNDDPFMAIAHALLTKPPCARTFDPAYPAQIADNILQRVYDCGAKGVIGYTMKFCDPYIDRLPMIRNKLQEAQVPFLLLEGDLSLASMGQQRTRIEAFIEMLR